MQRALTADVQGQPRLGQYKKPVLQNAVRQFSDHPQSFAALLSISWIGAANWNLSPLTVFSSKAWAAAIDFFDRNPIVTEEIEVASFFFGEEIFLATIIAARGVDSNPTPHPSPPHEPPGTDSEKSNASGLIDTTSVGSDLSQNSRKTNVSNSIAVFCSEALEEVLKIAKPSIRMDQIQGLFKFSLSFLSTFSDLDCFDIVHAKTCSQCASFPSSDPRNLKTLPSPHCNSRNPMVHLVWRPEQLGRYSVF